MENQIPYTLQPPGLTENVCMECHRIFSSRENTGQGLLSTI